MQGDSGRASEWSRWDSRAASWDEICQTGPFLALGSEVRALARPSPEDRVVDLGAGTGLLALSIAPHVHSVVAVDSSAAMLERLTANARRAGLNNVECVHARIEALPLAASSATLAVSNYAYHHLTHPTKREALREAHRVLAPDGRLVICDMMFSLSLRRRDRRVIAEKLRLLADRGPGGLIRIARNAGRLVTGTWEHPAPPERWGVLLRRAGFEDVSVRELQHEAGIAFGRR